MDAFGRLEGRQDYVLHGERWSQLYFSFDDDRDMIDDCRLPADAFDDDLRPGDAIRITMLLRTVMEIRRAGAH